MDLRERGIRDEETQPDPRPSACPKRDYRIEKPYQVGCAVVNISHSTQYPEKNYSCVKV